MQVDTKTEKAIAQLPGISRLTFKDEPDIRVALASSEARYRLSWFYVLRAARNDAGDLGFKFIHDGVVAIVGVRNDCVYITPLTHADDAYVLRQLCGQLYQVTQRTIVVRKSELEPPSAITGFSVSDHTAVVLEDDRYAEMFLDFHKLFLPDGTIISHALRWRRKLRAFASRANDFKLIDDVRELSDEQVQAFFDTYAPQKRASYMQMIQYMQHANPDTRYNVFAFVENAVVRGVYIYERLTFNSAGLYCGLTSKDEPGLTEWMDYKVFQRLHKDGLHNLLLGGAESTGVDTYVQKLLAMPVHYTAISYIYDPVADPPLHDVRIRPAKPSDIQALATLYKEVYNALSGVGERWTIEAARKLIARYLAIQPDLFFVAECEGRIVGATVTIVKPWWDGSHLTQGELFMVQQYIRTRLSQMLFTKMLQVAVERHQAVAVDITVPVNVEHPFAQYEHFGLQEVPYWRSVVGGVRAILNRLEPADS